MNSGRQNQIPVCEGNIAGIIYEQLKATSHEPWSIFGILGVKAAIKSNDSLTLKLAGVQKINCVVIHYNIGTDLYDISYHDCRVLNSDPWIKSEKVTETNDIDWENMAETIIRTVRN